MPAEGVAIVGAAPACSTRMPCPVKKSEADASESVAEEAEIVPEIELE